MDRCRCSATVRSSGVRPKRHDPRRGSSRIVARVRQDSWRASATRRVGWYGRRLSCPASEESSASCAKRNTRSRCRPRGAWYSRDGRTAVRRQTSVGPGHGCCSPRLQWFRFVLAPAPPSDLASRYAVRSPDRCGSTLSEEFGAREVGDTDPARYPPHHLSAPERALPPAAPSGAGYLNRRRKVSRRIEDYGTNEQGSSRARCARRPSAARTQSDLCATIRELKGPRPSLFRTGPMAG